MAVDFPSGVADTTPTFLVGGDSGALTPAQAPCTTTGLAVLAAANAAAARTAIGAVIGTNVEAQNANLDALAGLTSAADKLPYFTGSNTAALTTLTATMRTLLAAASVAAAQSILSLTPTAVKTTGYTAAPGDFIPVDTTLGVVSITLPTAPADKTHIAVKLVIQGGTNAVSLLAGGSDVFNVAGGAASASIATINDTVELLYNASGAIWYLESHLTLGALNTLFQPLDAELTALAALVSAADKLPYFTGSGTAALTTLSSFIRTLIDDADAATARATLGAAIGTNVEAWNANLDALAGLTSAADKLPYFTGSNAAAVAAFTAQGRSLVAGADAAANRVTIGQDKIRSVADADATVAATDKIVLLTTLTAARVLTLPAANAVNPGYEIFLGDASGNASLTKTITLTRAGADTINGATTEVVKGAYGLRKLVSDGVSAWTFDGGVARTSGATMTGALSPAVFALTDAATIAVDASKGNVFTVTLGGSRTIANPTNPVNGQTITFLLLQDGTGSRVITWDTQYRFSTSQPQPVLTTGINKMDKVAFTYNAAATKWDVSGYSLGYA